jgi:hypothetical protein
MQEEPDLWQLTNSPSPPDPRIATPNLFASDSDAPWLARKDWASGELCYNAGVKPGIFIGCIGLILLILAFPFAADLPHSIRAYGSSMLIPLLILGQFRVCRNGSCGAPDDRRN